MVSNLQLNKSREPRLLHLISSSGFLGAESVILELAKESQKAGYWVTIGVFENRRNPHLELAEMAKVSGVKVRSFPCGGRFDFHTISSIRNFIRIDQPNLLHSHGYKSNFYALSANRGQIPWVVTNHLWKRTTFNLKLYAYLDSILIRFSNKIVAVSDEIAADMLKRGISKEKITVIDNGIDLNRFSGKGKNEGLKQSFGLNEKATIIGTIASLTEEKGHSYLIQAAKNIVSSFPEARFLFVGDGRERHKLEEKTIKLGLKEKIIFTGSRKDIPEILSILDVFVLPSLKEGLPMALLEAMAARLPVVATRVGAIAKVVVNKEMGIIVEPGSPEALCTAISELLHDNQKAKRLGYQGYQKVENDFSATTMAIRYHEIYKEVLSQTNMPI